ncbi:ABC-type Fe3+ transport system permease component [Celeribacter indicus]|uniref:ABC-type Fe3+ transport system permease component n=1 Tax=Celeribacter indicus TaxID=1208324 RepID=A0A0B5DYX8_9RHOB|nr:ABC-type Fe3+ transport system permease component [Celeribacter indicus]
MVTLAPIAAILAGSLLVPDPVTGRESVSLAAWAGAAEHPGLLRAIGNTVLLALTGQVIALPLSVLLAWLLGRTDIPGARWLELGFWISFFLPVLAVLQGWLLLIDPHYGLINQILAMLFGQSAPQLNAYSWWGIVFAHLVTNTISAKVMLLTPVYQGLDSRLEEAAQLAGDSPLRTLWRITLPLTLPIVFAAGMIGLIRTLESFEIELILGIPQGITVYSTMIYDIIGRDPPDFATANVLGVVIILFLTLLATLPSVVSGGDRGLSQGHFVTLSSASRQAPVKLGAWRWPAFALVAVVVAMLTVVPVGLLITSSVMKLFGFFSLPDPWTFAHWHKVLGDNVFLSSLGNTLQLALMASAMGVALGTAVAYGIVRAPGPARRVLAFLSWLPSTMPGILFSLAVLWIILSSDALIAIYGSTFSLACAVALGGLTFSVQILKSSFGQIGLDMEEAAWLSGASRLRAILTVVAPLAMRSIAVVAVVAFVAATRSISNLALLVTSDNRPLALLQLEFMSQGLYELSAVVGVIVVAMAVVAALAIRALSTKRL